MSFAFGSNGDLWWAPDGQESSGAGTSEECGECEALLFVAPQDAALGDREHLELQCHYVEPAGGAPWGASPVGPD